LIEGYGATYGNTDHANDVFEKGSFAEALQQHRKLGSKPAMLFGHDHQQPLGSWERVVEDSKGLFVRGRLALKVAKAREVFELLRAGAIHLSVGFSPAQDGTKLDRKGVRHIFKVDRLAEISLVSMPANPMAKITGHKQERPTCRKEFEHALRDMCGFSARESKRIASSGFAALDRDVRVADLNSVLTAIEDLKSQITSR
jgi:HK97 family phage prohead protease